MNLLQTTCHAIEEILSNSDTNNTNAYQKFKSFSDDKKALIDDFFKTFLNYKFSELIELSGGEISKPLTLTIYIAWSIEDVQEVRPDLEDIKAAHVLEFMKKNHDATLGINWDTIEITADTLYPEPETQN